MHIRRGLLAISCISAFLALSGCASAPEAPITSTSQLTVHVPTITLMPGTQATQTEKGISVTLGVNSYSHRILYKVTLVRDAGIKNWAGDLAASTPGSDVFSYVQTVTPVPYPYATELVATVQVDNESQKTITIDGNNGGILYWTRGFMLNGKSVQAHGTDMPFNGGIVAVHNSASEKLTVSWTDLTKTGGGILDFEVQYKGDPFNRDGMPKPMVWHMKLSNTDQQLSLVTVTKEVRVTEDLANQVNGGVFECDGQVASTEQFDTALIGSGHCKLVQHWNEMPDQ